MFSRRSDIMGTCANARATSVAALFGTAVVLALNLFLILLTFGISIPGCSKAETLTGSAPRA
jgi:manganese transport protein